MRPHFCRTVRMMSISPLDSGSKSQRRGRRTDGIGKSGPPHDRNSEIRLALGSMSLGLFALS
jgi:hypothetical protein